MRRRERRPDDLIRAAFDYPSRRGGGRTLVTLRDAGTGEELSAGVYRTGTYHRASGVAMPRIRVSGGTVTGQPDTTHLRVIFLGGVGEVGKNVTVLECGDDIIVVDVGIGFPEEEMLGVDLLLPDITYLRERRARIRAIFITHGHEDHIGGLPYLLPELGNPPIYATRLTLGLIRVKLKEAKLLAGAELRELDPEADEPTRAGVFAVEPFRVCHSIPDAVGFGIDSPAGLIVATGDFKFDQTPADGRLPDFGKLAALGRRAPLALISDCVHVETPGTTPSERTLEPTFERIFADAPGRIIVATFASLIARVQQIIDIAALYGRKVAPVGRSLEKNIAMARELGYLTAPTGVLIGQPTAAALADNQVAYVVTGSQGEPTAALSRIASREHRTLFPTPGDTVIVSASPIPGNETAIGRIIDSLFAQGVNVIYSAIDRVHVSGHASREELKLMLNLTRPRYVVPFHGEARHLALYEQLAQSVGIPAERIVRADLGTVLEFGPDGARRAGEVPAGHVYVSGTRVGGLTDAVLEERRGLVRDGIIFVTATVARDTGLPLAGPELAARGFLPDDDTAALFATVRERLAVTLAAGGRGGGAPGRLALERALAEATSAAIWGGASPPSGGGAAGRRRLSRSSGSGTYWRDPPDRIAGDLVDRVGGLGAVDSPAGLLSSAGEEFRADDPDNLRDRDRQERPEYPQELPAREDRQEDCQWMQLHAAAIDERL